MLGLFFTCVQRAGLCILHVHICDFGCCDVYVCVSSYECFFNVDLGASVIFNSMFHEMFMSVYIGACLCIQGPALEE